jgi:hypothetical protein
MVYDYGIHVHAHTILAYHKLEDFDELILELSDYIPEFS